jgi:hypothetical protein
MKKSIKAKVVTGAVALALVSGVGVSFASSDAGTNLQNWYNNQYGKSAKSIQTQSTNYAAGKVPGLLSEYNALKTDAKNSINTTSDTSKAVAGSNITTAKQEHLDSLAAQKAAIESHLNSQFDGIQQAANTAIGQAGLAAINFANNDLTTFTGNAGNAARTQLTTDLDAATKQAVSELQAAIDAAKSDLQTQLDNATASRVEAIKHMIDAKIVELRNTITTKKNDLVAAQQALITAKAQELEAAAKAALEATVDGI